MGNSDDDFLNGGPYPGSFIGGNCGVAPGCNTEFRTYFPFNAPPLSQTPGIGRNTMFGPKYFTTDLSVGKKFGLWSEGSAIDLRFNFFNVFNQLNFAPFASNSNSTHVDRAQFGIPTNGLAGRVGEFQARFSF